MDQMNYENLIQYLEDIKILKEKSNLFRVLEEEQDKVLIKAMHKGLVFDILTKSNSE
ncbi:26209_t:CDS:2 [Gigaspora margarita]|uniref:26209_t:CDS:1 n=1 Tax=Gigaspora margarita TaxID=4874 RepID=A0ABN7UMA3_GIGMA|nr:26209_t:CDS:2 [Gigaspora margarita]